MLNFVKLRLARFSKGSEGSYSIETILVLPMLAWAILAMFSYFDGLRLSNVNIKASHTISDILSRETDLIDDDYMDSASQLLAFLINRSYPTSLRVSAFKYDEDEAGFDMLWSEARGGYPALTGTFEVAVKNRLPITADGDTVIVVETWMDYRTAFVMGLTDTTLYNFVVTSPRFAPTLLWDDGSIPTS